MGNCINKKKINHFENNTLIDNDEHLIYTMNEKINTIQDNLTNINKRLNQQEKDNSETFETISQDIQLLYNKINNTAY